VRSGGDGEKTPHLGEGKQILRMKGRKSFGIEVCVGRLKEGGVRPLFSQCLGGRQNSLARRDATFARSFSSCKQHFCSGIPIVRTRR
jgi:hypothetical protein